MQPIDVVHVHHGVFFYVCMIGALLSVLPLVPCPRYLSLGSNSSCFPRWAHDPPIWAIAFCFFPQQR